MTPETIKKLEEVFAIGGSDREACFYADISLQTLYSYQLDNPEFVERKEALKERPVLKARQTVVKSLENPHDAQWYLERKAKKEFSIRQEITGAEGKPIESKVDGKITAVLEESEAKLIEALKIKEVSE